MAEEYDDIGYYRARAGEPTWPGYFYTRIDFMLGVFFSRKDLTFGKRCCLPLTVFQRRRRRITGSVRARGVRGDPCT